MAIAIEKNVPLPQAYWNVPKMPPRPYRLKLPSAAEIVPELTSMQTGESIYIPNSRHMAFPPVGAVRVQEYGLDTGRHFFCMYDDDGMRVWRTA
jgi:hypothetical protein